MIGLGLVSYGRPAFREVAKKSIRRHLSSVVDLTVLGLDIAPVGVAKNIVLRQLLDAGCDWIFLAEDDIEVLSPKAITGYVEACEASGYGHLMFHAHGGHNGSQRGRDGLVTFWPNCVGAWCVYSRASLEVGGLFDETFHNAWEHVEHTQRLALAGFTAKWPYNADATGSEEWLREQPGAIENSAIRHTPEWIEHFEAGKVYWRETMPETFKLIWP